MELSESFKVKVTLKKARKEIELYIGRGTGFVASEIPFTPSKESVRNGSPRR
jgi:hypothetical protein